MLSMIGFLLGFLFGHLGTRFSLTIATSKNILDYPGEIKIHSTPMPRFGGLGLVGGTILGSAVLAPFSGQHQGLWAVLSGALIMALTGAVDDLRTLRPSHKLAGQVIAGTVFVALTWRSMAAAGLSGVQLGTYALVTVFFLVFLSNAMNLLDGMDGLAAGTSLLSAGFLAIIAWEGAAAELELLLATFIGSCLAFLAYNRPPARTFMGDIGSLFLGYVAGVAALRLGFPSPESWSFPRVAGILLILALPLGDTSLAILRRMARGRDIMTGDRFHLYDGLSRRFGGKTWLTLAAMWGLTFVTGALGTAVYSSGTGAALVVTGIVVLGMLLLAHEVGAFGEHSDKA